VSNYVAAGYVSNGYIGDSNSFGGINFDPVSKRIILSTTNISATEIYSRSVDWLAASDNVKYGAVFRQVGGDDLGDGLSIPPYFFLQGLWRIRPMEANHTLTITGNLFVDGGGDTTVPTLGIFNVLVKSVVPVQAQGISTSGGSGTTITAAEIRQEIDLNSTKLNSIQNSIDNISVSGLTPTQANMLLSMYEILGLDPTKPLVVSKSGAYTGSRIAGTIQQAITGSDTQTIVTRI